jgi:hypothetical protein
MTATLQVQAQETIAQSVLKHTMALCEALRQNYIDYSIRSHKHSIEKGADVHYHTACIQDLRNGKCDYDFTFESGKKYHKVIMHTENQRSVHCFIDKNTGEVYKSASWKSPAKGVRYDMRIINQREWMFENADWAGGYLYAR